MDNLLAMRKINWRGLTIRLIVVSLFILVQILFCASRTVAAEYPGIVVNVRGKVSLLGALANGWNQQPELSQVQDEDRLRTFEDSSADIVFEEGETISVASETSFILQSAGPRNVFNPAVIRGKLEFGHARASYSQGNQRATSEISIEAGDIIASAVGSFDFELELFPTESVLFVYEGVVKYRPVNTYGGGELHPQQYVRVPSGSSTFIPGTADVSETKIKKQEWAFKTENAQDGLSSPVKRMTVARAAYNLLAQEAGLASDDMDAMQNAMDSGELTDPQATVMVRSIMAGASSTIIFNMLRTAATKVIPEHFWATAVQSIGADSSDKNLDRIFSTIRSMPNITPEVPINMTVIGLASIAPPEERKNMPPVVVPPAPHLDASSFKNKPIPANEPAAHLEEVKPSAQVMTPPKKTVPPPQNKPSAPANKTDNAKPKAVMDEKKKINIPDIIDDAAKKSIVSPAESDVLKKAKRAGVKDDYLKSVITAISVLPRSNSVRLAILNAVADGMKQGDFDKISWEIRMTTWTASQIKEELLKKTPAPKTQPVKTKN